MKLVCAGLLQLPLLSSPGAAQFFFHNLFTTLSNYKYNNLRNLQYNVATHTFYSTPTVACTTYNTRQYNSLENSPKKARALIG